MEEDIKPQEVNHLKPVSDTLLTEQNLFHGWKES